MPLLVPLEESPCVSYYRLFSIYIWPTLRAESKEWQSRSGYQYLAFFAGPLKSLRYSFLPKVEGTLYFFLHCKSSSLSRMATSFIALSISDSDDILMVSDKNGCNCSFNARGYKIFAESARIVPARMKTPCRPSSINSCTCTIKQLR